MPPIPAARPLSPMAPSANIELPLSCDPPGASRESWLAATPAEFELPADWLASGRKRIIFDGVSRPTFCNRWSVALRTAAVRQNSIDPISAGGVANGWRCWYYVGLMAPYLEDQDMWWLSGIFRSVQPAAQTVPPSDGYG